MHPQPAHDISAKKGEGSAAAGVFTQPYASQYILTALEEAIARGDINDEEVSEDLLKGFLGEWGRSFYGLEPSTEKVVLKKADEVVTEATKAAGVEVRNYRAGKNTWSLEWA